MEKMISLKEFLEEKRGLWDNIHAKQERIKNGSGEKMRKPGSKGAPTAANFKAAQATSESVELDEDHLGKYRRFTQQAQNFKSRGEHQNAKEAEAKAKVHGAAYKKMTGKDPSHLSLEATNWKQQAAIAINMKKHGKKPKNEDVTPDDAFDLIEEMVEEISLRHNLDPELVWERFEDVSDEELFEAAVDAKGYKSSTGGLTQKGRDHYNNTEGGHLKAPVTTPPSKLKAGSKAANRRKSFCARMSGVEGPMRKPNGEPTRKALALRKWNC